MVPESRVNEFIRKYTGADKRELRDRIKSLKKKSKTTAVQAEIKAITALLA